VHSVNIILNDTRVFVLDDDDDRNWPDVNAVISSVIVTRCKYYVSTVRSDTTAQRHGSWRGYVVRIYAL
jgi:hypothetical protein